MMLPTPDCGDRHALLLTGLSPDSKCLSVQMSCAFRTFAKQPSYLWPEEQTLAQGKYIRGPKRGSRPMSYHHSWCSIPLVAPGSLFGTLRLYNTGSGFVCGLSVMLLYK